jgi:hypothetical protein
MRVKKGVGSWGEAISATELGQLHLGWYYNWTPHPKRESVPELEFVPMFWSSKDVTAENLALVNTSEAVNMLGFNEPDLEGQSNMTVKECLDLWPRLMPLKQRLGSPAPANPLWLEQFMPEAKSRGLRVDFVCIHSYPDISDPKVIDNMEAKLYDIHRKYGLPIWLTECGAANIAAWHQPQLSPPTPETARFFLQKLVAMLERLPFVERYAWFADRVGNEYSAGSLFDLHVNKLTPIGALYRDAC